MDYKKRALLDIAFKQIFKISGLLTLLILAAIFAMLMYNSIAFFINSKPLDFITSSQWNPGSKNGGNYGIGALLVSTLLVSLGANKWTTLFKVTLPAALPGLIAAIMLGLGRAIGETMTVLMATGNAAAFPTGFLDSVRTITATIAIEMGEVPYQTTHYFALFAIAAVLFLITLAINLIGEFFANQYRKFQP